MNSVGSDEGIFSESGGKLGLGLKKQNKTIFFHSNIMRLFKSTGKDT